MNRIAAVFLFLLALGSSISKAEDWVSPDPAYQEVVALLNKQYSAALNKMLNSFMGDDSGINVAIESPDTVQNWFHSAISSFPTKLPNEVRSYCLEQIYKNKMRWMEIAERRRYAIALKLLEKAEIKKAWKFLYAVSSYEKTIIVPAPEGFSVFIEAMNSPHDKELITFQPIDIKNMHPLGNIDRQAKIYKHFFEDKDPDTIGDLNHVKQKVIDSMASNGKEEETVIGTKIVSVSPIFGATNNSFCYSRKVATKDQIGNRDYFTAECISLINGYIYRFEVEANGSISKADEAWATTVLTSWRDAILAANGE